MRRKGLLFFISMFAIAVFLSSTVNVFAEGTTQDALDESVDEENSSDFGNFVRRRIGRLWKGKEGVDQEKVKENKQERFESMLSNLVDEGIITQDKSDEILKQYEEFVASIELKREERKPVWEQLLEEGILIEEEVDAIKETLTEKSETKRRARIFYNVNKEEILKERLSQLVDEGVLTQDKVDNIVEFIEDKISERQELKENGGFWGQIVEKGIITEEEAEEIKEYCSNNIKENFRNHRMFRPKFRKGLKNSENE